MSRSIRFASIVGAISSLTLSPSMGVAADRSTGIVLFGGYSLYAMGDLNDNLDDPSPALGPVTIQADPIEGGWGAGGGLRFWVHPKTHLLFSVEYLSASTEGTGTGFGGPYTGVLDASGIAVTASIGRMILVKERFRLGGTLGGGLYTAIGDIEIASATFIGSTDIDGNGPGFFAAAIADYKLSPGVALDGAIGYRYAHTTDVRLDGGSSLLNADGSKATVDWSGFYVRLGVAFYPKKRQ